MNALQIDRYARIDDTTIALRLFHSVNRKARSIAKLNGMDPQGPITARVTVSILHTEGLFTRSFHLSFATTKHLNEFGEDFQVAYDKANLFDRGVTVHIG